MKVVKPVNNDLIQLINDFLKSETYIYMEHTGKNVKADETYIANPKKLVTMAKMHKTILLLEKQKSKIS